MKKLLTMILAAAIAVTACISLVGCGKDTAFDTVTKENIKIGMITLHDTSSTYDKNFIESMYRALENKGLSRDQLILYTGIEENDDCYQKAKDLANQGCQVVFADSFGHEDFLVQAAEEFPNVRFCHATGTKAHTLEMKNFSNAFASIYEGRYLAGIAAGLKLNELGNTAADHVIGYVGAYTYAEVMSGYTSFYLGARSVCPDATMKVSFTGSWYDFDLETAAATALINAGCKLISQHADSYGAPDTCEEAGVPNVSYNGSTIGAGPTTYLVSSKIDWTPYFEYMIDCVLSGEQIALDWTGTMETGSVKIEIVDGAANQAAGTAEAIAEAEAALKAGTLKVFSTTGENKITVNGQAITSYLADVDYDPDFVKDTEVIANGYFDESAKRSAPYFDIEIDGIELLNRAY